MHVITFRSSKRDLTLEMVEDEEHPIKEWEEWVSCFKFMIAHSEGAVMTTAKPRSNTSVHLSTPNRGERRQRSNSLDRTGSS